MAVAVAPPGPKGLPIIGNLGAFRKDSLGLFETTGRDYGPVARLDIAGITVYLLTHPDPIEEVLVKQGRRFRKSSEYRRGLRFLGNGLVTSEGDFWLRQRRLVQPAFHRDRIASYGHVMVEYAERLVSEWEDGEERDISDDMMRVTLEIVAKALFDTDIRDSAHDVGQALDVFLTNAATEDNVWELLLPQNFPTPARARFNRAMERMDEIIYGMVAERRRRVDEGGDDGAGGGRDGDHGDLMSMLLAAQDEDNTQMSDIQLRDELVTLIIAGHETTANALMWTWYALSQAPRVVAKLHAELDDVLGGRAPTVADLPNLRYTEMVVKEAMRLYPPVPAVGREALEDCVIAGYDIPKGSQLIASLWVVQRDPQFFDDPLVFNPDRWEDGLEKRLPRYAYFPFGGGARKCVGEAFAMMEAVLLLATIAQRFELSLVDGHPVIPKQAVSLRSQHGMRMVLRKRGRQGAKV